MNFLEEAALILKTVQELEQLSHEANALIQEHRQYAILIQRIMGDKIEAERISNLLGRPVQIINAVGIQSKEGVGTPSV